MTSTSSSGKGSDVTFADSKVLERDLFRILVDGAVKENTC
jgi:hypothetical protein